jgi:hypothetical protein
MPDVSLTFVVRLYPILMDAIGDMPESFGFSFLKA